MRMRVRVCALLALLAALGLPGGPSARGPVAAEPPVGMAAVQMAFLTPVPDARRLGEREIQAMQEGHLAYLRQLFDEGKAVIEGPIHGEAPFASVVVLDVPSTGEAQALLGRDPWVASGQKVARVHPWWTDRAVLKRPAALDRTMLCYLGLLERPESAPGYTEERLQEIQRGHLANIRRMAESGDLALAGPMGDDTSLRGILVFRSTDTERIRSLVQQDPAVQAGRLRLVLFPWYVPAGVF